MAADKADGPAKEELQTALTWSLRVNEMVAEIVKHVPPFPYVRESLEKITEQADILVCSSTPVEALLREWAEHDIAKYTRLIAGQETGSKAEHLAIMTQKYDPGKILMMGDALGDQKAAETNNTLFYPINPGQEAQSWKRFHDEAFDKFLNGQYPGPYQDQRKEEFAACLPEQPSW
jgi:phosphoglycolate phosphatase-like HAD superfamily hydrolase